MDSNLNQDLVDLEWSCRRLRRRLFAWMRVTDAPRAKPAIALILIIAYEQAAGVVNSPASIMFCAVSILFGFCGTIIMMCILLAPWTFVATQDVITVQIVLPLALVRISRSNMASNIGTREPERRRESLKRRMRRAFSFRRSTTNDGLLEELGPDNPGDAKEIRLFDMRIGDDRMIQIANSLRHNTKVTILNLSHNEIGEDGAFAFAVALKDNTTLERVNLGGNQLGLSGILAIANALALPSSSIQHLSLPRSELGDLGVKYLATRALTVNVTLKDLFLQDNMISDGGAASLAEALRVNTALTSLDVSDNIIGDAGIEALVEGLKVNTSLKCLFLGDNRFSVQGLSRLVELLANHNSTLTIMDAKKHRASSGSGELEKKELKRIAYYLALNQSGRSMLQTNCASNLIPHLLERVSQKPSIMFGLIQEQPHMFARN